MLGDKVLSKPGGHRTTKAVVGILLGWGLLWVVGTASPAAAEDALVVGSIPLAFPGQSVSVPIFLRDDDGTLLGADAGTGRTIQNLSLDVRWSPLGAVDSAVLERAGISAQPAPIFETAPTASGQRVLIASFDETVDPLSTTLDPSPPGDLVAKLTLQIDGGFDLSDLTITLTPAGTALGNQTGTLVETVGNNRLVLFSGIVQVNSNGLFADGFESGDVSAWSNSAP